MAGLTYLALGTVPQPEWGAAMVWGEPSAPRAAALYRARVSLLAGLSARTRYVCWADGGADAWDPAWPDIRAELIDRLDATGAALGYCDETVAGLPVSAGEWSEARMLAQPQRVHHGVICRLDALRAIDWPAGCFHWETLAYHALGRLGAVYLPRVGYHWHPTPDGAHAWADTQRGICNAVAWLRGQPGAHFPADLED